MNYAVATMKASFIIRLIAAVVLATLGCIGLAKGVSVAVVPLNLSGLFLIPRGQLTRPIPRSELWKIILFITLFVSAMITLSILQSHFHWDLRQPSRAVRVAVAVPLWLLLMSGIYYRWRRMKGQADT